MDFLLNEDQRRLKEQVIRLCEDTLSPLEERIGETNIVSREIAGELARAGLFRLPSRENLEHNGDVFSHVRVPGARATRAALSEC